MNTSKLNQLMQGYDCGLGKALFNLFDGKLEFVYPLISMGANSFKIDTYLIYNSKYKSTTFNDKKIGFGNGWKLNFHQYVFPYNISYNIPGFEVGNYVYIDSDWNIHKFVEYKKNYNNEKVITEFYDYDDVELRLLIGENIKEIVDNLGNRYHFNESGKLISIKSCINEDIIKKIEYTNGNITSIYDNRKKSRRINFTYNSDGMLAKSYSTINSIGFQFEYYIDKLIKISKSCSLDVKEVMEFQYDLSNKMEYAINCSDLMSLHFNYSNIDEESVIIKVENGVMKKEILTNDSPEVFLGEKSTCGEGIFSNNKCKKYIGYKYTMPPQYIKNTIYINYYDNYTQVINEKGYKLNYYFDMVGNLTSILECKDNNLYTLNRFSGLELSCNGSANQRFNGKNTIFLDVSNNYTYEIIDEKINEFKNLFKDENNDNIRDEEFTEHFIFSFWIAINNNKRKTMKTVLRYTINGVIHTGEAIINNIASGSWRQVSIPINLGLEQLSINSMELLFEGEEQDMNIQIAELKVMKGVIPHLLIDNTKIESGTKLCYCIDDVLTEVEISPNFFMTESDVFSTYKSLYLNNLINIEKFDLIYNNGTQVLSVDYVGIRDSNNNLIKFLIENNKLNCVYESIDILSNERHTKTTIELYFKYDEYLKKHYFENKIIVDLVKKVNDDFEKEKTLTVYNSKYFDGLPKEEKNENNVIIKNLYDNYGNLEMFKVSNKDSENEIKEEIIIKYNYEHDELLRENPYSYSKDGNTIEFKYDVNEVLLKEIIEGNKITKFLYDRYQENVEQVLMNTVDNKKIVEKNIIKYNSNGKISSINNNSNIIYGYKYNIFSNVDSVYRNNIKIFDSVLTKNNDGCVEIISFNKNKNETEVIKKYYDENNRLIMEQNGEGQVQYVYEDSKNLYSKSLERITNIIDGCVNENYNIKYNDNDISSVEVKIDNKISIESSSDGTLKYKFLNENEEYMFVNEDINNIKNSKYYLNEKILEDYSFNYKIDDFGRFSEKNGTISVYKECDTCGNNGEQNCESIDGVKLDKKITYHNNTYLPKTFKYTVTSKGIHVDDDFTEFYYENSCYDNVGNITHIVEGGTNYKENPKSAELRNKSELLIRNYSYEYDSFNRLTKENNSHFGNFDYIYDESSGMLKEIKKNGKTEKQFEYNAGFLTNIIKDGIINTLKYDYYGNVLYNGKANLKYNSRNLMELYDYNDINESPNYTHSYRGYYSYNYEGVRNRKRCVEEITGMTPIIKNINYYLNGTTILGEDWSDVNGNIIEKLRYFYDAEGICGIRYDGYNFTLVKDSLGNVSKVMYKGKIIGEYIYDAWGNFEVKEISVSNERDKFVLYNNPFRYKGYYCDLESGLYYCQTRYYDPNLCIWLSPDSVQYIDPKINNGANLYCYCNNNPIMYVDPSGHLAWWIIGLIITAVLLIAGGTVGGITAYQQGRDVGTGIWEGLLASAMIAASGWLIAGSFVVPNGLSSNLGLMMFTYGAHTFLGMIQAGATQIRYSNSQGDHWASNLTRSLYANIPKIYIGKAIPKTLPVATQFTWHIGEKYAYTIPGEGGVFYDYRTTGEAFSIFKKYLGETPKFYQKAWAVISIASATFSTFDAIFGEPQYDSWKVY